MKNSKSSTLCFTLGHGPDDVGISGVCDGEGANAEVLAAGCAQLNVVAGVVVDAGLGQHGVVLNLGLPVMQKEQVKKLLSRSIKTLTASIMLLKMWCKAWHY